MNERTPERIIRLALWGIGLSVLFFAFLFFVTRNDIGYAEKCRAAGGIPLQGRGGDWVCLDSAAVRLMPSRP